MNAETSIELSRKITALLYEIEHNYPELYRYLDEDLPPVSRDSNEISDSDLKLYLEGLKEKLQHYQAVH